MYILQGVEGDFLEAGVWRGGASIFAAGFPPREPYITTREPNISTKEPYVVGCV